MKKQFFFTLVLLLLSQNSNAQFTDDFENYTDGEPICSFDSNAAWQAWCTPLGEGCCMIATTDQAHSGILSGKIPGDGTTTALLNLRNKIFGTWCLRFCMYIPSNKEATFNIQGQIPPVGSGQTVVGNINFNKDIANPGIGFIDWNTTDPSDDTFFDFPHDEWFWIVIGVDISTGISTASWIFIVDALEVISAGTPFADGNGVYPTSLGGINFPSAGPNNQYFIDDIYYSDEDCLPITVNETEIDSLSIYPNPVNSLLIIENSSNLKINSIKLFDLLGNEILEQRSNFNNIDVSSIAIGAYFVTIDTENGIVFRKVVKL